MGQKVNPISNRLGIIRGWDSNWYGGKEFGDSILEDSKIRKYLGARLGDASISRIVIERTLKMVTITVWLEIRYRHLPEYGCWYMKRPQP